MTINPSNDQQFAQTISFRDALERVNRITTQAEAKNLYASAIAGHDDVLVRAIEGLAAPQGWDLAPASASGGPEAPKVRALLVDLLNAALPAPKQLSAAETHKDPRLTADALNQERTSRVATAIQDLRAQATGLVAQIDTLTAQATNRADAASPALDPNDAAQLARTAQAWQFSILPLLGANPNWHTVMDGLDLDGLLAIQRFAPAWIKANSKDAFTAPASIALVLDGVEDHIPAVVTDPKVKATLQNAEQAEEYQAIAHALTNGITAMRTAADAVPIGITVQTFAGRIGATTELVYPAANDHRMY